MRKFLIGYRTPTQYGRFFHDRDDDTLPTEENIVALEARMSDERRDQVLITGIVEIAVTAPAVIKPVADEWAIDPTVPAQVAESNSRAVICRADDGSVAFELSGVKRDSEGRVISGHVDNGNWELEADHERGLYWPTTYPDRVTHLSKYTGWAK